MLTKRAKYALNALVELARAREAGPLSASLIAVRAHVPGKFLEAILLELGKAGIISSRKGRGGGYRLARIQKVSVADVFRLFDGAIALVPCATFNYYERCEECVDEATCGIRAVFMEVRATTVEMLKQATIADLIAREQRMKRPLKIRKGRARRK